MTRTYIIGATLFKITTYALIQLENVMLYMYIKINYIYRKNKTNKNKITSNDLYRIVSFPRIEYDNQQMYDIILSFDRHNIVFNLKFSISSRYIYNLFRNINFTYSNFDRYVYVITKNITLKLYFNFSFKQTPDHNIYLFYSS